MTTFSEVEEVHRRWLYLDYDKDLLRIVFATVIANRYDGCPVWLLLVGRPGAGKTAAITGIADADECYQISNMTPAALASGATGSSFLDEVTGKVMVMSDFSTISTMPKEAKEQVYAFFRDAYDGHFSRVTGKSNKPVVWEGKFGLIGCTTTVAVEKDILDGNNQALGERFMFIRLQIGDKDVDALLKAKYKASQEQTKMKEEIRAVTRKFLTNFVPESFRMSAEIERHIIEAAKLVAKMRGMISRNRYSREIDIPVSETVEVPTRLVGQIRALAVGLFALGTPPDEVKRIINRLVVNASSVNRSAVLKAIMRGIVVKNTIAKAVGMDASSVGRTIDELELLGIVEFEKSNPKIINKMVAEVFKP